MPDGLRAEIRSHNGAPAIFVDGEPLGGAMYMTWFPSPERVRAFRARGVRVFCLDTTSGCHYYRLAPEAWKGPGEFDFSGLDRAVGTVLDAAPDALVMLRVYVGSPEWWDRAHPDELMLDHEGRPVAEKVDFAFLAGRDPGLGPAKATVPSFSSLAWRTDAGEALGELVRHAEERFGGSVIGYLLETGGTEEWYYWDVFAGTAADYSRPQREGFAAWAAARGIAGAEIPSPDARRSTLTGGFFRDPEGERAAIAYGRYHSEVVADTILAWARAVKDSTAGRKLCGAFYGYTFDLSRAPHVWQESGHLALRKVLGSPDIDFLAGPTSYLDRRPGEGLCLMGGPAASVALAGKLWIDENDQYTHLTPETGSSFYLRAESEADSVRTLRREAAACVAGGASQWWFDMHGGWYDSPALMDEIARLRAVMDDAVRTDRTSAAEIALVIDYESPHWTETDSRLWEWLVRDTARELAKCGAPFDVLLLDDVARARGYRLYVFANAFRVDDNLRASVLSSTGHDGRTAVWLYAPGYLGGDVEGAASVGELVGMRVAERRTLPRRDRRLLARAAGEDGDGERYGPGLDVAPQLTVEPRAGDEVLAIYEDDPAAPALVRAASPAGGKTVLACVPGLPRRLWRRLARDAGVHVYTDAPDQVWACGDCVALAAGTDGERTIRLRRAGSFVDAFSGREHRTDAAGDLVVEARRGDAFLFRPLR